MREIRVDHVSKSFGKAKALDDVSLSFEHGKIHALLGRNGAGKSTLLGLIANRLVPTSGRIFVDDEPAADNARALAKLYCMNDKKMYPENLRLDNLFKEMGRFYRHVLVQKRYPHHGAVAFSHVGKYLFEVFKFLGVTDIAYNQPKSLPYPTENPWA